MISWLSAQLIYEGLYQVHIYKIYILKLTKDFVHQLLFALTSKMSFVRTPCFYPELAFARVPLRHLWILKATQHTKTVPKGANQRNLLGLYLGWPPTKKRNYLYNSYWCTSLPHMVSPVPFLLLLILVRLFLHSMSNYFHPLLYTGLKELTEVLSFTSFTSFRWLRRQIC